MEPDLGNSSSLSCISEAISKMNDYDYLRGTRSGPTPHSCTFLLMKFLAQSSPSPSILLMGDVLVILIIFIIDNIIMHRITLGLGTSSHASHAMY